MFACLECSLHAKQTSPVPSTQAKCHFCVAGFQVSLPSIVCRPAFKMWGVEFMFIKDSEQSLVSREQRKTNSMIQFNWHARRARVTSAVTSMILDSGDGH